MSDNGDLDRSAEELAELVFDLLANCHEKETRIAERNRLTSSEFRCLRFFQRFPGPMTNKEIADKMGLTPGRLSRILDGLYHKHYITRKSDGEDRRFVSVSPSSKGLAVLKALRRDNIAAHRAILEAMNVPKDEVIAGMKQFLGAIRKWLERP